MTADAFSALLDYVDRELEALMQKMPCFNTYRQTLAPCKQADRSMGHGDETRTTKSFRGCARFAR